MSLALAQASAGAGDSCYGRRRRHLRPPSSSGAPLRLSLSLLLCPCPYSSNIVTHNLSALQVTDTRGLAAADGSAASASSSGVHAKYRPPPAAHGVAAALMPLQCGHLLSGTRVARGREARSVTGAVLGVMLGVNVPAGLWSLATLGMAEPPGSRR